jgi:DNA-binding LacI/PurR family transcriptional regulator
MVRAKSWSAPPNLGDGFPMFSSKAVQAINEIVSKTNADIVLTTSHRDRFSCKEWTSIFRNRNIDINILSTLSAPDFDTPQTRATEIRSWFATYTGDDDFIIIDDDTSLNSLPQYLKDRVVQTKPMIGLTPSHVDKAIELIHTPMERV